MTNVVQKNDGLLHWHGALDLSDFNNPSNPLLVSISAHAGSYITTGASLYLSQPLLVVNGTFMNPVDIIINQPSVLQLGPKGNTQGMELGQYQISSFTVYGSLVLQPDFDEISGVSVPHLIVDTLTIPVGGSVNSDQMGYRSMRGPLPGLNAMSGSAGGHAGRGVSTDYYFPNKVAMPLGYGDALYPESMGSGGAPILVSKFSRTPCIPGGVGGGAVHITVAKLSQYGTISATGQITYGPDFTVQIPAGAAGSIWIECTGTRIIDDSSGIFAVYGIASTYPASAGRIKVDYVPGSTSSSVYVTNAYSGAAYGSFAYYDLTGVNVQVQGYSDFNPVVVVASKDFYPGNVPLHSLILNGATVEIPAGNSLDFQKMSLSTPGSKQGISVSGNVTNLPTTLQGVFVREAGHVSYVEANLEVSNGQKIEINGTFSVNGTVVIDAGGSLALGATGNTEGSPKGEFGFPSISVSGELKLFSDLDAGKGVTLRAVTIDIPVSGRLHADYTGYGPGAGKGPAYFDSSSGILYTATHASAGNGTRYPAYGNFMAPSDLGSGGWSASYLDNTNGGGAFAIYVRNLTFIGSISAVGGLHASAGSIYIEAATMFGQPSGTIDVCGSSSVRVAGRLAIRISDDFRFVGPLCAGTYVFLLQDASTLQTQPAYLPGDFYPELVPANSSDDSTVTLSSISFLSAPFVNRVNLYVYDLSGISVINYATISSNTWLMGADATIVNYYDIVVDDFEMSGPVQNYGHIRGTTLTILSTLNLIPDTPYALYSSVTPHQPSVVEFDSIDISGTVIFKGPTHAEGTFVTKYGIKRKEKKGNKDENKKEKKTPKKR
eukprot:Phypoly_transcript_00056.p1 GENE.Phypoly_transcript_00056~~Phypoly_transcript_00056.p1  ORF type:complete len:938 (+),score=131.63 Phypoly_transcript_00056:322-2814(+)